MAVLERLKPERVFRMVPETQSKSVITWQRLRRNRD